jgi:hypothetical protein
MYGTSLTFELRTAYLPQGEYTFRARQKANFFLKFFGASGLRDVSLTFPRVLYYITLRDEINP